MPSQPFKINHGSIPKHITLIIGLTRSSWSGFEAQRGLQRLFHMPLLADLEDTGLLGQYGAIMLGVQHGNQFCDKCAGLLRGQITWFLPVVNKRSNTLGMALL